jgi:methionine synthase II (cobalamin-independent)
MRFQVSLPSPLAPLRGLAPEEMALVAPCYEARLCAELDAIAEQVPRAELAIQWDVAVELALLEGVWPSPFGAPEASFDPIAALLARLGARVPPGVELGYHLCYGDIGHRHLVEPRDTGLMVRLANAVAAALERPLDWLHLPVPIERDDAAYFAPLRALRLPDATELYLGLVHLRDGAAGAQRRIAAAQRVLPREFGVATECGLGRRPPETVAELLELQAKLARAVAGA